MAKKADLPITLLDAVRVILRALCPEEPTLADGLSGWDWLHNSWMRGVTQRKDGVVLGLPVHLYDHAHEACNMLIQKVREPKIGMVGSLDGAAHENIQPLDCAEGKLSLREATLRVEIRPTTPGKSRWKVYERVSCVARDVRRITVDLARPKKTPGRITPNQARAAMKQAVADGLTQYCAVKKHARAYPRDDLREMYNNAALAAKKPVRPGRR